jgi:hypothetical protein
MLTGIGSKSLFYRMYVVVPLIFRGDHGYTGQNDQKYQCKLFCIRTAYERRN